MQVVDDLDLALARANALPYGLAGYDFTPFAASAAMCFGVIGTNHLVVTIHETSFGTGRHSGWAPGIKTYTVKEVRRPS
ncbi:hypothetical protein [Mesorhizobium sp. M2A.F.Ca.ET.037.01.1.1]|uniref:hypothetical protein n=1 Tax=Mesorhizobium sp. M2A.F.Ca.ET.037.01.1.1 TaxID=2496748 RepID=UPI001FE016DA|nr:hypothetical protein [Mesorhizobium sp. M2A.F.Ca.ET.037.01.1.1]